MKTVTVCLPYGEGHLEAEIPERYITSIIKPREMTPLENPHEELERSLVEPIGLSSLFKLAEDSQNPCIIVSDSTRPTPSGLIVSSVLNTLNKAGIKDRAVSVIVATGLHRPSSGPELVERLGAFVLKRVKPENHDAYDEANLVDLGETSKGTPILINRKVHESDLIIGDGYIEPHFFAGYTGGGKNILPGVSGFETVKVNHGAIMIDHPKTRAGVLEGNPIYEDIVEGARMSGLAFSINVTLNSRKQVSGVFSGDFEEAHMIGTRFLDNHVKVKTKKADIVIATNNGYPLDRDLYQAVKGMTVAEATVYEGGVAIVVSECRDGVGHPLFKDLVERCNGAQEILDTIRTPGFFQLDQWEAQVLARVLTRCHVICVTDGVEPTVLERMHITPANDMEDALSQALNIVGRDPKIAVIPGGPSTIPCIQ